MGTHNFPLRIKAGNPGFLDQPGPLFQKGPEIFCRDIRYLNNPVVIQTSCIGNQPVGISLRRPDGFIFDQTNLEIDKKSGLKPSGTG
jgi:hypothetical protein